MAIFNKKTFGGDAFERAAQEDAAPEEPIVQVLHLDPAKYGLSKEETAQMPDGTYAEKVTFPIFDKSGMYVLEAVRCDIEPVLERINKPEKKQSLKEDRRNMMTFIIMGGGSSGAIDNFHFLFKTIQGVKNFENNNEEQDFPVKVRVIILPHISSAARIIDQPEFKTGDNFVKNAEILYKALEIKELKVTHDVGLIGFSSGGPQVTELASLLKDRCKFVALADAAGMSEFPNLIYEYTIGQLINTYKKYRNQRNNPFDALVLGFRETLNATSTISGNLKNILDLLRDYTFPIRKGVYQHSAKAWGMNKYQGENMPINTLRHDSTKDSRKEIRAPVIFAPVLYAKVVNTLLNGMKEKIQSIKTVEDLGEFQKESPEEFDKACNDFLKQMFPGVSPENLKFKPYDSSTHTSISEQKYWDQILDAIATSINNNPLNK